MSDPRPDENEFLQAVDLNPDASASKATPAKTPWMWLLPFLLLLWTVAVYYFFTRERDPEVKISDPMNQSTEVAVTKVTEEPTAQPTAEPRPTPLPVKKILRVETDPPGAAVLYQNQFIGSTPLEIMDAESGGSLLFQLSGYDAKRVRLSDQNLQGELRVDLEPLRAQVRMLISPESSQVELNGAPFVLPEDGRVLLPLVSQELRVEAPGFETQTLRFTPAQAYERLIEIQLNPLPTPTPEGGTKVPVPPPQVETISPLGVELITPDFPMEATLGSPRGTAGRQSNEVQVNVKLSRVFQISKMEIRNGLYRQFKPGYSRERWKGVDMNADSLPVTGVTWEDAVRFCNWLSEQEGLPPAYVQKESGWEFQEKPGIGYRLPTEAEWESLARWIVKEQLFGWGDTMPPPQGSVNIAGKESQKLLGVVLETYTDSFAGPAPVDQAGIGPLDVKGLYGNVREWVQDGYGIPPLSSGVIENPLNSAAGKFHVIKGASWQDAGIGDLRIARRRYGNQAAVDLGFRVARYLE